MRSGSIPRLMDRRAGSSARRDYCSGDRSARPVRGPVHPFGRDSPAPPTAAATPQSTAVGAFLDLALSRSRTRLPGIATLRRALGLLALVERSWHLTKA